MAFILSVRSPASAEDKSIWALILLSLHVAGFQLIAAILLPTEVEMFILIASFRLNIELLLFLFAGFYLALSLVWGLIPSHGGKLGLALSAVSVGFIALLLTASRELDLSLPRSGLFVVLSLVDSLAIVVIVLTLHILARAPRPR